MFKNISKIILILLLLFLSLHVSTNSSFASIIVTPKPFINSKIVVPPSAYTLFNLPYLQRGASVAFQISVLTGGNRDVNVFFLNSEGIMYFKKGLSVNQYGRLVKNSASFSFPINKTDNYYLVIDNRFSLLTSKQVSILAHYPPWEEENYKTTKKYYEELYSFLGNTFIFRDFNIKATYCQGQANAFYDPRSNSIIICHEHEEKTFSITRDYNMTSNISRWVFYHELGHALLYQWGLPGWDSEDRVDEFATVILLMEGDYKPILDMAKYYMTTFDWDEVEAKVFMDDRHALTPQRARNLINWFNNPNDLLRRWQTTFVPRSRTEFLLKLYGEKSYKSWVDSSLITEELKKRGERQDKRTSKIMQKSQKINKTMAKEKNDFDILLSEEIKDKWSGVKLIIEDKVLNETQEVSININDEYNIPDSSLKIKVGFFLPDFKRRERTITSVSNNPNNPVAGVQIIDNGRKIFPKVGEWGWMYAEFPSIYPFQHKRFGVILKEGIKK